MVRTLIGFLLLGLVTACGSDANAPAPVRLQVFGDPLELRAYRELIASYEALQPGAKVELIPVGRQTDHMAKLSTAFAAGDPPELFVLNFRRFGQFADKRVLTALGPAMTASGQFHEDEFYTPAIEAFRYQGELVCLPQNVSSLVVYYNRALFRHAGVPYPAPGWHLHQLLGAAQAISKKAPRPQGQVTYGLGFEPTLIRLAAFIWGFGGELVDSTENPKRIRIDGPALSALRFVKFLNGTYGVVPPLAAYKSEDHESRFARGALGMLLQSRRFTASLRQTPNLDWDVAPFPIVYGKPVSVLHADAYCQAASARDPAAAQRFVAYALSAEGQGILTRSGRLVPSRKTVAQSPVFLDPAQPPASAQVFLDAIPSLRRTPNIAAWHEIESKADVLLEEWFYESATGGAGGAGEEREGGRTNQIFAAHLRRELQTILQPGPPAP